MLPYTVILGRDFPNFFELWGKMGKLNKHSENDIATTMAESDELGALFPFMDSVMSNDVPGTGKMKYITWVQQVAILSL